MAAQDLLPAEHTRRLAPSPSLEPNHLLPESALEKQQRTRGSSNPTPSPGNRSISVDNRVRSDSNRTKASQSRASQSRASGHTDSRSSNAKFGQNGVRTLPPWIDSVEYGDDIESAPTDSLLQKPGRAIHSQHHYSNNKPQTPRLDRRVSTDGYIDEDDGFNEELKAAPTGGLFNREPNKGRKWDHAREGDPVIMQSQRENSANEWSGFIKSSMYGPQLGESGKHVDSEYLDELTPGYKKPWVGDAPNQDPEKALGLLHGGKQKRLVWYQRAQRSIVSHPLVPLAFRLTVLTTSTIALGLSASIFHLTNRTQFAQTASAVMAIIVDCIALPYIGYITWDEYTGKPLGLRPPKAKMRLVLLDLFFIIFESANLSLAFQAITDQDGSCLAGEEGKGTRREIDGDLCAQEKALASILFVALVAWGLTFAVSIIRFVNIHADYLQE